MPHPAEGHEYKKEVPKQWHELEEQAERAQNTVLENYENRKGVRRSAVANQEEQIKDWHKPKVQLIVEPDHADINLPERLAGIPVEKVVQEEDPEPTCDTSDYEESYDPAPAGVSVTNDQGGISAGWHVKKDGNKRMMTCAHQFDSDEECEGDGVGTTVKQGGEKFGEVTAIYPDIDIALVDTSYGGSMESEIYGISGICGPGVSRSKLNDLRANQTEVAKTGKTTCRTTGTIKKIDQTAYGCEPMGFSNSYGVELDILVDEGDSGGPIYWTDTSAWTDAHYAIGLTSYNIGDDRHRTTASYHVNNQIDNLKWYWSRY